MTIHEKKEVTYECDRCGSINPAYYWAEWKGWRLQIIAGDGSVFHLCSPCAEKFLKFVRNS